MGHRLIMICKFTRIVLGFIETGWTDIDKDSERPTVIGIMLLIMFFRPSSSTALRNSGCRITTTAVTATLNRLFTIQRMVFISK